MSYSVLERRCSDGEWQLRLRRDEMKPPVTFGEAARVVLIVALALPFAWNGYRPVHLFAELPALLALFVILVVAMVRLWTDRPRLPLWRRVLPLVLCLLVPYVGGFIAADVCRDRALRVSITREVPMYARWEMVDGRPSVTPVGRIGPIREQQVLRVRFGKDFMAIRVRNQAGTDGWIMGGGDVRVLQ